MVTTDSIGGALRFGAYQASPATGELYKHGIRLRLQEQPFQVLLLLLERPGEVVSREELRRRLWAETTFVDFDHCLNIAINKLREALNDSPENPRFIETLPKRGYRFIAPVERQSTTAGTAPLTTATSGAAPTMPVAPARHGLRWGWAAAAATAVLAVVLWVVWQGRALPPAAGPAQEQRLMLAVLPFENLSGDPQQEYFIAGLTEEMIAQLGRMHASRLGVIARTSVLQYAGTRKPIAEVGRELHVGYVLEGTVRREGERVRITTQLVEAAGQTQLWAEIYDRTAQDVLRVQSEVAHDVARALALQLLPGEAEAIGRMPTEDMGAYDDYLRARHFWNRRSEADFLKAVQHLESAIQKDGKFARAYVALADTYNLLGGYAFRPAQEAFPKAKEAARKAMTLDPALSGAYAALGFAAFNYDWDFPEAEKQFREALRRNPNNAAARQWYAELLHAWGRLAEAREEIERAAELDPFSMTVMDDKGWILVSQEKLHEAIRQFEAEAERNPQWPYAYYSLASASVYQKGFRKAHDALARARAAGGETARYLQVLGMAQAFGGETQQARETLARLLARPERERGPRYGLAAVYSGLGEKEAAIAVLEKAFTERESWMVWVPVYPEWAPLRGDARFQDLLRRINLVRAGAAQ
jgi:TolB-like protein/DNA-binding winged helix-turn-helix (wHTH) protein/Tfp pilus assembly protein PilF